MLYYSYLPYEAAQLDGHLLDQPARLRASPSRLDPKVCLTLARLAHSDGPGDQCHGPSDDVVPRTAVSSNAPRPTYSGGPGDTRSWPLRRCRPATAISSNASRDPESPLECTGLHPHRIGWSPSHLPRLVLAEFPSRPIPSCQLPNFSQLS